MKAHVTILFIALTIKNSMTQTPNIEWAKCYGGTNWDEASAVFQSIDSGYFVIGETQSFDGDILGNHGAIDGWLVKLDAYGEMQWQKCYGGTGGDHLSFGEVTQDGGLILVGYGSSADGDLTSNYGSADYWIVKTNADGIIEWQKSYGGSSTDLSTMIYQTIDGGYIVGGRSESNDYDVSGHHGEKIFEYNTDKTLHKEMITVLIQEFELRIPEKDCTYFYNARGLLIKKEELIRENSEVYTFNYTFEI